MTTAGFGVSGKKQSQPVSLVRNYTYDIANRLTGWNYVINVSTSVFPVESNSYTYDQNGNRTFKQKIRTGQIAAPQQTTYSYDFENQLKQLSYLNIPGITGTQTDSFTYSGDGLRTQAVRNNVTANYLYDGFNVLNERDGSGNATKSYTRGLDFGGGIGSLIAQNTITNSTPVTQYYNYDDLGSVANLTTTTGTTASSYSYDAYGNLLTSPATSDTNTHFFSTKELDSREGLYYFGARYYDPEVGRWITPDPLGMIDGTDTYLYVDNSPENFVDSFGLQLVFLPGQPIQLNPIRLNPVELRLNFQKVLQTPHPSPTVWASPKPTPALMIPTLTMSGSGGDDSDKEKNTGGNAFFTADNGDSCNERNSAQDKKLSPKEIKDLEDAGYDVHVIKYGKNTDAIDLYKDKKGNVYIKPKGGGCGPGEPTGINLNNL